MFEFQLSMTLRRNIYLLFAVLVAIFLLLLCYSFLNNPLIFDDEPFFREGGPAALLSSGFSLTPRLWVYDSMAANIVYFSDKIVWLRLGNLFLHFCTALVIFGFIRNLLGSLDARDSLFLNVDFAAFISAFLFAIHPLAILTQGYLIQRTIICATLLGVLGLWMFWQGLCGRRWALWGSCFFVFLSLYAKEHAVMLPALCFLLWVLHRRSQLSISSGSREIFVVLLLQGVMALSVVLWARGMIGSAYEIKSEEVLSDEVFQPDGSLYVLSVLNQMGLFFKYLAVFILPRDNALGLDLRVPFPLSYSTWWAWAGLVAFISYGAAAFVLLLRGANKGGLGFALLFPWVMFATELASVRLQEPFVLYRSYLWAPGLFFALALGLRRLKKIYIVTLVPVFLVYFFGLSYDRLLAMSMPVLVWDEAVQYYEAQGDKPGLFGGYRVYYNLGVSYLDAGYIDAASKNIEKALELKPSYEYAYYQRGKILLLRGKPEDAKVEFEHAINLRPSYARPYVGMADAFKALGQTEESQRYLELGCGKGNQLACSRAYPKAPLMLAPKA
ncbi:Tetratricopeptide repeat-containing protein [Pseudomonas asplenii]|uniref:Tetratricopeptide repeat-containing protein n=1 Tax=Pseudomonas asplenii TaxID=53407 RepID=A0A1H1PLS0_9PSED|nr:tetratricopeptide repeat protein [Pseudomonas asplenii]SDS12027.1 Tetratricopeptide repeat-containing protein [Pseudomonas asplenii]